MDSINQLNSPTPNSCNPTVSVVVPTHFRPVTLAKLLESLQRQSYPHHLIEVIVVAHEHDAKARRLVEIHAEQADFPIRCFAIPDDPADGKSPSAKRNFGVEQATGAWIAFIDDDCEACPDWIARAEPHFHQPQVGAVEGQVQIPAIDPPTMTYKGLLLLTKPGGYQTCNIFYKRDVFLKIGGFDLKFPFYLEDSDLAWSLIDAGYKIPYAAQATVFHPVVAPAPWRLLAGAKRSILMPYLYQKHPQCFKSSAMHILLKSDLVYLSVYGAAILLALLKLWSLSSIVLAVIPPLVIVHLLKLTWGCRVSFEEVWVGILLLPTVPLIKLVQLVRGNFHYKVWLWR